MYFSGTGAEFWHKYFYENVESNRIVLDSVYAFPIFLNGINAPLTRIQGSAASYLTYDKKGRIIKDSTYCRDAITKDVYVTVNTYSYDAGGNRTGRTYDDKVNIHRTNKIWMFFDRDYSVNNPFIAESYNSIGLPTKVNTSGKVSQPVQFLTYLGNPVITYKCK